MVSLPPIERLADIPFACREPLDLLALTIEREQPDLDYTGFGHCRIEQIWLEDARGEIALVEDARLLALHSSDLGAPLADDVELEFFLDRVAPGHPPGASVTALLSAFLRARLAGTLRGDERAIVLAMCNPHGAALPRPAAAGDRPVHYAIGDVDSWLDPDGARLRLTAEAWRIAGAGEAP